MGHRQHQTAFLGICASTQESGNHGSPPKRVGVSDRGAVGGSDCCQSKQWTRNRRSAPRLRVQERGDLRNVWRPTTAPRRQNSTIGDSALPAGPPRSGLVQLLTPTPDSLGVAPGVALGQRKGDKSNYSREMGLIPFSLSGTSLGSWTRPTPAAFAIPDSRAPPVIVPHRRVASAPKGPHHRRKLPQTPAPSPIGGSHLTALPLPGTFVTLLNDPDGQECHALT